MCIVSYIHDYGKSIPPNSWTYQVYDQWKILRDAAKVFDEKTGQPHCEDPEKVSFEKEILERLKKIEDRLP